MGRGLVTTALRAAVAVAGLTTRAVRGCGADEERATVRFNVNSDRLYLEGAGCITPSQIYEVKLANDSNIPLRPMTKGGKATENETG